MNSSNNTEHHEGHEYKGQSDINDTFRGSSSENQCRFLRLWRTSDIRDKIAWSLSELYTVDLHILKSAHTSLQSILSVLNLRLLYLQIRVFPNLVVIRMKEDIRRRLWFAATRESFAHVRLERLRKPLPLSEGGGNGRARNGAWGNLKDLLGQRFSTWDESAIRGWMEEIQWWSECGLQNDFKRMCEKGTPPELGAMRSKTAAWVWFGQ